MSYANILLWLAMAMNIATAIWNISRLYSVKKEWETTLRPLAFSNGVLQGYIIGKFRASGMDVRCDRYSEAMQVIDELEAETAWQMALMEDQDNA